MPPRVRGRYPLPASGTRAWRPWSRYTPSGPLWPAPEPPAGTIPAPGRTTSCMTASPALRSRRAGCRTLHRGRATGHDATSPSDPQTWIGVSPARGSRRLLERVALLQLQRFRGPSDAISQDASSSSDAAGRASRLPAVRRSVSAVRYVLERAPGPDTTPRDSSRSWLPSARLCRTFRKRAIVRLSKPTGPSLAWAGRGVRHEVRRTARWVLYDDP